MENSTAGNWGLDRIDQESPVLDSKYAVKYDGTGVTICYAGYGARVTHEDFGGRAYCAFSRFDDNCTDFSGYTGAAGVMAGAKYGVAKNVSLAVFKSIAGFELSLQSLPLAFEECMKLQRSLPPGARMVIAAINFTPLPAVSWIRASKSALDAGMVVVAAGFENERGTNACLYRPGSVRGVISVGTTFVNDTARPLSGIGRCVDIFAPGSRIETAWYQNDTDVFIASGNLIGIGFVAGVAALHLQKDPTLTPAEVLQAMEADAVKGAITFPRRGKRTSPNLLLNTKSLQ